MLSYTMYVVISTAHLSDHDRTFVHGIFQDQREAEAIAYDVRHNWDFIREEGYVSDADTVVSVYVSNIPMGVRVDDFVPTLL